MFTGFEPCRFINITARLKKIEEDGVSAIWDVLRETVAKRMFDEFGSLYTSKDDQRFTGLVDGGLYLNIEQLPCFQKVLSESEGYRKYCSSTMKSRGLFFKKIRQVPEHEDGHEIIESGHGSNNPCFSEHWACRVLS